MTIIKDFKDLKKLVDLCRKQGISSITLDGVSLQLGALPEPKRSRTSPSRLNEYVQSITPGGITEETQITTDELTPEQILMWSASGGTQTGDFT